jgi:hypothetical protein
MSRPPLARQWTHGREANPSASAFREGQRLAVKHGAYSPGRIRDRADEILIKIRSLATKATESDEFLMRQTAYVAARIELAYGWIDEHGIFKPGTNGVPAGILQDLNRWENQAIRCYNALGLSPMSRMDLRAPDRAGDQAVVLEVGLARGRAAMDTAILEGRYKGTEADRVRLGLGAAPDA